VLHCWRHTLPERSFHALVRRSRDWRIAMNNDTRTEHVTRENILMSVRQSPRRTALLARLSEAALLKRARGEDVGAFEELIGRTEDRLYRLAMRYVGNESDAQEILQNAYLSAWRSLPTFEGRSQFRSWMHRITVNASLMFLRVRDRCPEVAIDDIKLMELNDGQAAQKPSARKDWSLRPDEEFQSAELRRHIAIAVSSLPQTLKVTFLLRDVVEMSTEETASRLGVSVPAVKTRIYRARRVLRESLGDYVAC
jgi:RNA polymerase sigma-70 factor, ECF subfamily